MIQQFFPAELKVNFNLRAPKAKRPTDIFMICRLDGKQLKLTTEVKVYPDQWSKKRQKAYVSDILCAYDNQNNETVNQKIEQLKQQFNEFKNYLCNSQGGNAALSDLLKQFIYKDMKRKNTKKESNEISATLQMRRLNAASDKKDASKDVGERIIKSFERFFVETKIKNLWKSVNDDTFRDYEKYLESRNVTQVTIKNHFNVLKALCRKASKDKKIDFSYSAIENFEQKKNKTNEDEEEGKQVVLTEDEVQKIYEYKSDNDKINEVKDIFVLQCELGQRIGDMSKFFCGEYKKDTEFNTVSIIQQKKNKTAIIPLFPLGEKILKKYEGGLKHTDDLNKRSTQNYINKHIKQICKEVGINDMRKYDIQEGLTVNSYRKPRCELIHTHTARHTFITNMCLRGVPENELIIATGHTDETMIKKVYKHLTPKDKSKIVGKWRNIGKSEGTTITNDEISKAAEDFKGAVLKAEREKRKKEVSEITDYVNKDISRMQEEAIKISELIKKSSL